MCGELQKSIYGARDAALSWEAVYTQALNDAGFKTGQSVSCPFYNEGRDIQVTVHGDDIIALACRESVNWLREQLQCRFEIKAGRIGPVTAMAKCDAPRP